MKLFVILGSDTAFVSQTVLEGVIETVCSIGHAVLVPRDCIWIEFDSLLRNERRRGGV